MANVVYECAVNKSHGKREFATAPGLAPTCCGKPMVKAQIASAQPAAKPTVPQNPPGKPAPASPMGKK